MIYHAIGIMSGSSMDGLDIAYCIFEEIGGKWTYTIQASSCIPFDEEWQNTLHNLNQLSARELMLTDRRFGQLIGNQINAFIQQHDLEHKIHIIGSHGHTVFHEPAKGMTLQIGSGADIAAITGLAVVSNLRDMDIALGGQGAPIVPIGEKLLWDDYAYFLNIGGISNISCIKNNERVAYDVCSANRVLNELAKGLGLNFDKNGETAAQGNCIEPLLQELNDLSYYTQSHPKSLHNEYGTDTVMKIIQKYEATIQDKLRTYTEHIAQQIAAQLETHATVQKMLVTGGGAFNQFLMQRITTLCKAKNVETVIPDTQLIEHKEAMIMALIAVLRWREEENVIHTVTGAARSSVGGALWMGQS